MPTKPQAQPIEMKAENEATLVPADGGKGGLADATVFPFLLRLPTPFLSHPARSRHEQGRKGDSSKEKNFISIVYFSPFTQHQQH